MRTLVLGLGNEILADDAVGIVAARRLGCELEGQAEVAESGQAGLGLLQLMIGYERVLIIDAVQTSRFPPGTIREYTPDDLDRVVAPSPHYAGIPELLMLAERLRLDFPRDIRIFAVEAADLHTIGGPLSPAVSAAVDGLVDRVKNCVSTSPAALGRCSYSVGPRLTRDSETGESLSAVRCGSKSLSERDGFSRA